jgi:hypothetical protein
MGNGSGPEHITSLLLTILPLALFSSAKQQQQQFRKSVRPVKILESKYTPTTPPEGCHRS